ncbi:unnamed protein product [Schistosoma margrebowiei]|uniref:Uncharacterized protein n=1 Tax=Schistosoma margrebowiei TaxID=48269 RepID=A0A183MQX9_9TREM|nr:unnamed protein product [Schistosoma margrebowiei]
MINTKRERHSINDIIYFAIDFFKCIYSTFNKKTYSPFYMELFNSKIQISTPQWVEVYCPFCLHFREKTSDYNEVHVMNILLTVNLVRNVCR